MTHKPTQIYLLFVIILVVAGVTLVAREGQRGILRQYRAPAVSESQDGNPADGKPVLTLARKYISSANAFFGTVLANQPCEVLKTDAELDSSQPEQIKLLLTTEEGPDKCKRGTTKKDFTIIIPSSEQAQLKEVRLNGQSVAFKIQ